MAHVHCTAEQETLAGGTACGLAGPSSDGYSSGNGLLAALGMGWIVGDSLSRRSGSLRRAG